MQHIGQIIKSEQGQTSLLTKSENLNLISFQPEEQQIIKAKYAGKHVSLMTEDELSISCQGLILKIHVITGWKLSENEVKLLILQNEFQQLLVESYPTLNVAEVLFAFRKYSKEIKEFGKDLNLANISEVLDIYIAERSKVSEIEAGISKNSEIEYKPTDIEIENNTRGHIEALYQEYLLGKLQSYRLLPHYAIDQLYKDGFCGIDLPDMFIEQAIKKESNRILLEIEDLKIQRKTSKIAEKEIELCSLDTSETVKFISKRMALLYFFGEAKKARMAGIYLKND